MPKKDTTPDLLGMESDAPKALSSRTSHPAGLLVIVRPQFRLMVQAADCAPYYAGPHIRRAEPLPIDRFAFETQGEAVKAAAKLQIYIDREHSKTAKKKKA